MSSNRYNDITTDSEVVAEPYVNQPDKLAVVKNKLCTETHVGTVKSSGLHHTQHLVLLLSSLKPQTDQPS